MKCKIIKIPLIPCDLKIFVGKSGFAKFLRECQRITKSKWTFDENVSGYCFQNIIWIYDFNLETVFHECSHFYDWLFEYLDCKEEDEFKAYLVSYISVELIKFIGE